MNPTSKKQCTSCHKDTIPLTTEEQTSLYKTLSPGWTLKDQKILEKSYHFSNFAQALAFTNQVGALAEQEGHHPDIMLSWGRVHLQITTHKIHGLSLNDFILAAKCDLLQLRPVK